MKEILYILGHPSSRLKAGDAKTNKLLSELLK